MAGQTEDIQETRMSLATSNVLTERKEKLKELFPEAFAEGEIDFERLRQALGDFVGEGRERYGLSWAGKADAIRAIQSQSVGTLLPCPEESMKFDTTENLFIEGDNLEVLKLLQKSYYGKVKTIYIDPPYNTGNDFIYPDNFREGLDDYLRYSGQVDSSGVPLSTNTETAGRYHSKWLSMMYPRLFLARNLLRTDGVIFVSIDDHEVHNLRLLMDEVFGQENFVASVIWHKIYVPKNSARHFSDDHDYILVYARDAEQWKPNLLPRTAEQDAKYTNPDNDPRGRWRPGPLAARNYYSKGTYPIACPSGRRIDGPPAGSYWRYSEEKFKEMDADGRIYWGKDGDNSPATKLYLSEVKAGRVPQTIWHHSEVGHTQDAKRKLLERVTFANSEGVFDTPKPPQLVERILRIATNANANDLVLDFFAGSGTTAEAVFNLNREDQGNRRFILVQLPERTGHDDFKTVADIGLARIRSASEAILSEEKGTLTQDASLDLGFKLLRLTSSNFKVWSTKTDEQRSTGLESQLKLFADHVIEERTEMDILYELLLKSGLPLTSTMAVKEVGGQTVYSIANGLMAICLANPIDQDCLRAVIALEPQRVICLDAAFQGNDQLKTNAVLEMKSHGIEFRTV